MFRYKNKLDAGRFAEFLGEAEAAPSQGRLSPTGRASENSYPAEEVRLPASIRIADTEVGDDIPQPHSEEQSRAPSPIKNEEDGLTPPTTSRSGRKAEVASPFAAA